MLEQGNNMWLKFTVNEQGRSGFKATGC